MKKLISLICAVAILFTAFGAVGVSASSGNIITDEVSNRENSKFTVTYNLKTNELIYDGYGKLCDSPKFSFQNVASLKINEGATVIGMSFFGYSKKILNDLVEVTIPKSTKRILFGTFKYAPNIKTVHFGGTKAEWDAIVDDGGNDSLTKCSDIKFNVDVPVSVGADKYTDQRYRTINALNYTGKLDYYTGEVFITPADDKTLVSLGSNEFWINSYKDDFDSEFTEDTSSEAVPENQLAKILVISSGVTKIEADALCGFLDNKQGYAIKIPKSVKVIGGHMANTHPKVYYEGSKEDWKKIKFGETSGDIEHNNIGGGYDELNCLRSANVHYAAPTKDDHIPDTPKMVSVKSTTNGIEVRWESTFGASRGYRVYRREAGKGWQYLKTVHKLGYHDSEIKKDSGKIFRYTVKAVGQTKLSNCEKGILIRYVQPSNIKRLENHTNGIKIFWHSIKNADSYRVYRKLADGKQRSWKYLTTVDADTTQYFDKEVKNCSGKKYAYCIRTVDNGIYSIPGSSTWYSYTRLATPDVKKAVNVRDGVKVTWKEVEGAEKYNVYRRGAGGSWKLISTVKSTSYIDKSVKNAKYGTPYRYTVRAVAARYSKSGCEKGAFVRIK